MEERSLRITGADKTFFNKITKTITKMLIPTKIGINGMLISMKRNNVLKAFENYTSENENYTNSDEPDSTSQLEEYEDIPNSESNEDSSSKDNENYNIYKVERAKGNEFKNLIKLKDSTPSYLKSELLNKLLNYIQSNSTIIKLECK
jgi:hypothetical protein